MAVTATRLPIPLIRAEIPSKAKQVCDFCRRRKIKCDRLRPSCTTCRQRNVTCRYLPTPARSRPFRPPVPSTLVRIYPTAPQLLRLVASPPQPLATSSTTDLSASPQDTTAPPPSEDPLALLDEGNGCLPLGFASLPETDSSPPLFSGLEGSSTTVSLAAPSLSPSLYVSPPGVPAEPQEGASTPLQLVEAQPRYLADPDTTIALDIPFATRIDIEQLKPPEPDEACVAWTERLFQKFLANNNSSFESYLITKTLNRAQRQPQQENGVTVHDPASGMVHHSAMSRSLFIRTDLLFHSTVLDHLVRAFCGFLYPETDYLHHQRVLVRLANGYISDGLILALATLIAPMSPHPIFTGMHPFRAGDCYYQHLVTILHHSLEDQHLDSLMVLFIMSQYEISRGNMHASQCYSAAVLRKFQQMRGHIMDHPHPPPISLRLSVDDTVTGSPGQSYHSLPIYDLVLLREPIIKENLRIMWWSLQGQDTIAALMLGYQPTFHFDEMYVNLPLSGDQLDQWVNVAVNDPTSPLYTDPNYISFLIRPQGFNSNISQTVELQIIAHQVAELRAHQTDNPAQWYQNVPIINADLERWRRRHNITMVRHPIVPVCALVPDGSALFTAAPIRGDSHTLVLFHMVRIYLNHAGSLDPKDLPLANPNHLETIYDSSDPTLLCGRQLCWESVECLRFILDEAPIMPAFFQNTIFVGSLYAAAMLCIEATHHSTDPALIDWANEFIDEILMFFTQFGHLWAANRFAARQIREVRTASNSTVSLILHFL